MNKTEIYELFWRRQGTEKWEPFDHASRKKYDGIDAAIERSIGTDFMPHHHEVRVWRDAAIIYEGRTSTSQLVEWLEDYKHGINDTEKEKGVMATYRVQFMRKDRRRWTNFSGGSSEDKRFTELYDAYKWAEKRSGDASFHGTLYRVWNINASRQEGRPYLNGSTHGAQIEAERRTGTTGIETHDPDNQEGTEMEYEPRKALNVKRTTLIEKLEAKIAEDKAKHDEAKAKEEEAAADKIEALRELVEFNPTAFVKMVESYVSGQFFAEDKDGELGYAKDIIDGYNGSTSEFVPEPTATKLISVLTAAVDDTIEVTPSDDFYRYL